MTDRGNEVHGQVLVVGETPVLPTEEYVEALLRNGCQDCLPNYTLRWGRTDDLVRPQAWDVTTAHDETCPSLAAMEDRAGRCPECRQGKHANCAGWALDESTDEVVACPCMCR